MPRSSSSARRSTAAASLSRRVLCLDDFEPLARARLPRALFEYIRGGAEDGSSVRANRQQFHRWAFLPATLRNTAERHTRVQLFDTEWAAPFGIAPMGGCGLAAYRADLAMAAAAARAQVPHVLSGASLVTLEKVIQVNPHTWFQAYLVPDPAGQTALLDRVAAAGYRTLVITTDVPVPGYREADLRNGYTSPLRPSAQLAFDALRHPRWLCGSFARTWAREGAPHFENFDARQRIPVLSRRAPTRSHRRDAMDWTHIERLRAVWPHRLVLKGLLDANDVTRARTLGADGVWISNHGGRQLDGAVTPLQVLAHCVAAAQGLPVICDSGFRRGSDILKALALGADFAFIGRPMLYAVAAAGEAGVSHAIALLQAEMLRGLALLGARHCNEVAERVVPAT